MPYFVPPVRRHRNRRLAARWPRMVLQLVLLLIFAGLLHSVLRRGA